MRTTSGKTENEIQQSANQISEKKQDIKYDTRDYVIDYLVHQFEEGVFYIPLDYQRNFIWTDKDRCFFIESVLMGLPIPFMFFSDTRDGRIEIVDGAQRVQTLVQFAQNDLVLKNLSVLTDSNDFKFRDFDKAVQRRFLNTSIRVVFLEEGTTESTRQEIFKRINTGGRKAQPSEARRGSYEGKFKDFIEECTKNEEFNLLAPRTKLTEDRYEGFELVSRFFAYTDDYDSGFKNYHGTVAKYIDTYVQNQNKAFEKDASLRQEYKKRFEQMLNYAHDVLGDQGFRKSEHSKSTPRARFEALSIGIAVALKKNPDLPVRDVSTWITGKAFSDVTKSDAANNKKQLIKRIDFVKKKLLKG